MSISTVDLRAKSALRVLRKELISIAKMAGDDIDETVKELKASVLADSATDWLLMQFVFRRAQERTAARITVRKAIYDWLLNYSVRRWSWLCLWEHYTNPIQIVEQLFRENSLRRVGTKWLPFNYNWR